MFALGSGLAPAGEKQAAWNEFTSKESRFSVVMPDTPKPEQAKTENDFGKGVLHMRTAQAGRTPDGAVANLEGKPVGDKVPVDLSK
jgi:hypothetical protein